MGSVAFYYTDECVEHIVQTYHKACYRNTHLDEPLLLQDTVGLWRKKRWVRGKPRKSGTARLTVEDSVEHFGNNERGRWRKWSRRKMRASASSREAESQLTEPARLASTASTARHGLQRPCPR